MLLTRENVTGINYAAINNKYRMPITELASRWVDR
jgi:hypothetical protein